MDRVVIDWPAAAMADPGVRRPPAEVLSGLEVPSGGDGPHAAVLAGLVPLNAFLRGSGPRPRRRRSLVLGQWLTLFGVLALVVGGFVLAGNQAAQVLAADDRAQVPDPMRFEAEDARYTVILLPSPLGAGVPGDPVAGLACDVVRAGPTTVTCDFVVGSNSSGYFVSVAEQRPGVTALGLVGMVGGGLVLALGIVLTVLGARGRATR